MKYLSGLIAIILLAACKAGHEVLYGYKRDQSDFHESKIAIAQYDSRELDSYWKVAAELNRNFAGSYGHLYTYFTSSHRCKYDAYELAPAWCKVKAMLFADSYFQGSCRCYLELMVAIRYARGKDAEAIIFLDSDAIITVNYSMSVVIGYVRKYLHWDMDMKPVAFNQDGPGWSCKHALQLGVQHCFNSGVVFWKRSLLATQIIQSWWDSSAAPYSTSLFRSKWRTKWPWEQAQMYWVFSHYQKQIQVLSFPNMTHLPWTSTKNPRSQYPTDYVEPWCFTHWPGANCFITHYCASKNQKMKMLNLREESSPMANETIGMVNIDGI